MIQTIDALIKFTKIDVEEWSGERNSSQIERPGCSIEELERLKKVFPEFPESYTKVIRDVDLNNIELGGASLYPACCNKTDSLVDKLIRRNNTDSLNPFLEFDKEMGLFEIGSIERVRLTITYRNGTFPKDQIIAFDTCCGSADPEPLAPTFEQFLFARATLCQIGQEFILNPDPQRFMGDFQRALDIIMPTKTAEMDKRWKIEAEMAFDPS